MINVPTVFVLGAGASSAYGLPTGAKLTTDICNLGTLGQGSDERHAIHSCLSGWQSFAEFVETYAHSGRLSIDDFLSRHPAYLDAGKAAIATILLRHEAPKDVFRHDNKDDWYSALWEALAHGAGNVEELARNSIRFISFNYDRSLEYFFEKAVHATYPDAASADLNQIDAIQVLHMYGQLGSPKFYGSASLKYGNVRPDPNVLHSAMRGIRVIPESRSPDAVQQRALEIFGWAEQVCFLGFRFHPYNIRRLGFRIARETRLGAGKSEQKVYASTLGLTDAEIEGARKRCEVGRHAWHDYPEKNLDCLRRTGIIVL